MNINTENAIIRLVTIVVAGVLGYAAWVSIPDPTIKGAATLLLVAVAGAAEQAIKPQ